MVKGLADAGLHTVMDVVYNHTAQSGMGDKSVFDTVDPGYYQRRDIVTGNVLNQQCCNDMGTEWQMSEKMMFDTALRWVRDYKVDGFRFDIMAGQTLDQMQRLLQAAKVVSGNPNFYIYGEGWNTGGGTGDKRYVSARQDNLGGTGIGSFNDRIRDAVRGGGCCDSGANLVTGQGVISGLWYDPNSVNSGSTSERASLLSSADRIREAMAGGLKSYSFENSSGAIVAGSTVGGYTNDPQELVNYVESHDNQTLWDLSQFKQPAGTPTAVRVRAQNVGTSMVLLAQGVPFIQAGQEMLRSKSTDTNSYNSGDWFNEIDWTLATSKWAVGLPPQRDNAGSKAQATSVLLDPTAASSASDRQFAYDVTKEWLRIRKSSQLFRLRTAEQVKARMTMLNTGTSQQAGVIAYRLDGCASPELDVQPYGAVVAIFNPTKTWAQLALFKDEGFVLHPVLVSSVDATVKTATFDSTNGFRVPPRTTAVFVKNVQTSCSPYGVPIFVRGSFTDWAATPTSEMKYVGGTSYQRTIAVTAGAQQFKVADNDWTGASNCGAAADGLSVPLAKPTVLLCDNNSKNLGFTPPAAGDYTFSLDAANKVNPVLVVGKAAPFGSTTMYVRGGFNDWGNGPAPSAPMTWDGLTKYRAEVLNMPAGAYQFKVADANWTGASNCGAAAGGTSVTLGLPFALTCDNGSQNIGLTLAAAGSYLFAVDGSNPAALQLTVEQMPFAAALYVRGLNTDWSASTPTRMSYLGSGLYKYTVQLAASAQQFKVADAGWTDGTNCGTATPVAVGAPLTLKCVGPGNDNIAFTVPSAGFYDFSMNATSTTAPVLTVSGP
jgi:pullulanase